MEKCFYIIKNFEDYGILLSYCIDKDISVYRTYYKPGRCYSIDYKQKRCFYSDMEYYSSSGYIEKDVKTLL